MIKDLERARHLGIKLRRYIFEKEKITENDKLAINQTIGHKVDPLIVSPYYWQIVSDASSSHSSSLLPLVPDLSSQLEQFQRTFSTLKQNQQAIRWIPATFTFDISITFTVGQIPRFFEGVSHLELVILQAIQSSKCNISGFSIEDLDMRLQLPFKDIEESITRLIKRQILTVDPQTSRYSVINFL